MNSLKKISENLDVEPTEIDVHLWGYFVSLVLKLQSEGASFFIKSDGERASDVFTIMIEGGKLGDDYLKCETNDLQAGINRVISDYSLRFWS